MSEQEHCKFFVQRKKRFCKMLVKQGQQFCGEHQKTDEESTDLKRIPCPLDPKHTVYLEKLDKHLKICNARQKPLLPYIEKDINSGRIDDDQDESFQFLASFSDDQITAVINKVNTIFQKDVKLTDKKLCYKLVQDELEKEDCGAKAAKHLKQVSAILGLLTEYGMLKDNTSFIEFGAGRGQLTCWIAKAIELLTNCKLLLVDRASPKHKRDNKLRDTGLQRIRADIADLVLNKVDGLENIENIVGVTKHLCGVATDLAIRCMINTNKNKSGLILTFCCHHRCRWTSYTGKSYFHQNELGLDEFNIMCGLSSWATCGTGFSRELREKLHTGEIDISTERMEKYGLNQLQREEVGRKCKNVLNWGRLRYLQENGYDCSLHYYVDQDVTLENVCIVARK